MSFDKPKEWRSQINFLFNELENLQEYILHFDKIGISAFCNSKLKCLLNQESFKYLASTAIHNCFCVYSSSLASNYGVLLKRVISSSTVGPDSSLLFSAFTDNLTNEHSENLTKLTIRKINIENDSLSQFEFLHKKRKLEDQVSSVQDCDRMTQDTQRRHHHCLSLDEHNEIRLKLDTLYNVVGHLVQSNKLSVLPFVPIGYMSPIDFLPPFVTSIDGYDTPLLKNQVTNMTARNNPSKDTRNINPKNTYSSYSSL